LRRPGEFTNQQINRSRISTLLSDFNPLCRPNGLTRQGLAQGSAYGVSCGTGRGRFRVWWTRSARKYGFCNCFSKLILPSLRRDRNLLCCAFHLSSWRRQHRYPAQQTAEQLPRQMALANISQ
jgi:hypothetical protein